MALKTFDAKFGEEFIKAVPATPGIYRVFNKDGELVYVGKAKNLRRRLSQYRNAKRRKVHRKMKLIVAAADAITYESCASDADAQRLELELIQTLRPELNVVGIFHFMYPMIGIKQEAGVLSVMVTTCPQYFADFKFHGCYRSRKMTTGAFYSLSRLMYFFGSLKVVPQVRSHYATRFDIKGCDTKWTELLHRLFEGKSKELLPELCLAMLEKSGATQRRVKVTEDIEVIDKFWKREVVKLTRLRQHTKFKAYPVPQMERDRLVLNLKLARQEL
jgi:excinuclease ABC subunit C